MAENMLNSAHKATNRRFRDNYDSIFGKRSFTGSHDPYGCKCGATCEKECECFEEKTDCKDAFIAKFVKA